MKIVKENEIHNVTVCMIDESYNVYVDDKAEEIFKEVVTNFHIGFIGDLHRSKVSNLRSYIKAMKREGIHKPKLDAYLSEAFIDDVYHDDNCNTFFFIKK